MRPPSRSEASSRSTSRWRSRHAADRPAIPPPMITTSRVMPGSSGAAQPAGRLFCLVEPKAELLSLQQVRCFCAALETGSFTAAAAALRVSQPAVAEQIRKLEQTLGTDLFVRVGRGVLPTEAGRAFAEHATRSLRALEDAAGSVGELTSLRSGTISVGVFSGPLAWRLEQLVATFLRSHPNVAVRLIGRNSSAIVERVRSGELEAGLVLLPIDDERLDVRPLVRDEVLYVSADSAPDARAGDDRASHLGAARLLRRRVRRRGPDPAPARRARAGARGAAAAARRGRADRHRAAARGLGGRRHLPAECLHPRAVLPGGPAARPRSSPRCTTRSRSSPAPARGSPPAFASCSRRWRSTCARWPTSSTDHASFPRPKAEPGETLDSAVEGGQDLCPVRTQILTTPSSR